VSKITLHSAQNRAQLHPEITNLKGKREIPTLKKWRKVIADNKGLM
jgi:hypothetical protein